MSTFHQVRALEREGYNGAWRAGRKWPSTPVRVEVLDQDDDPPMVEETYVGPEGKTLTRMVPDPLRIGRKSYQAVKDDPRIKVLDDADAQNELSNEALDEARTLLTEQHGQLVALRLENATLRKRNTELQAALERKAPAEEIPDDEVPPEGQLDADETVDETEGKAENSETGAPQEKPPHGRRGSRR